MPKRSWESDVWQFNKYLADRWGSRKVATITRPDVRQLHHSVGEEHGKYTANRLVAQLRGMYNFAKDEELFAGENPAEGIRMHPEESRERRLHADEMPAFVQAVNDEPNQDICDYVMASLLTAARKANVLAMRWDQINLDRATWTIPQTKNGKPQTIALVPVVVDVLQRRRANAGNSPYVFPGTGVSGHLADPKKGWKRILDRAGITDLHLHDLRRTMGSYMADTGSSLPLIGNTLGHRNPSTTAIYARLSQDPVRRGMELAADAMFSGIDRQE
jgi:integrase